MWKREGASRRKALVMQQPNTYEAERNKRVAKVQERLQLLLSAKSSMWVGSISGFFVILGLWVLSLSVRPNWNHGMWSMVARTVTPTCSPPNPKSKYLIFPYATCFDAIFLRTNRLATPIPLCCERCSLMLALLYMCQIRIRLWEEIVGSWSTNPSNLLKPLFVVHLS